MGEVLMYDRRASDKQLTEHQLKEEMRLVEIENNIKQLEAKIDALSTSVSDLVTAWKAASWLVSSVKWLGGIAVAVAAIITLFRMK